MKIKSNKALMAGAAIMASFCLFSCGNPSKNDAGQKTYEIKRAEIPAMLTSSQEKLEYMTAHFWDHFDFSDTTALSHSDDLEQALVDYLSFLQAAPYDKSVKSIKIMLGKAETTPALLGRFTELYEKYLYEPNSPMRNEELYIPVLEFVVNSDKVDELDKLRPRSQLEMALKNRPGQKAADITVRTANGSKATLYGTKAEYTILFINNPDCNACAQITAQLANSRLISALFDAGTVKIFAVYPDEDIAAWRNHLPSMPPEWINGYDESLDMRNKETYDLKAIPSVYLLDKDKKVILKDLGSAEPLEQYFMRNRIMPDNNSGL